MVLIWGTDRYFVVHKVDLHKQYLQKRGDKNNGPSFNRQFRYPDKRIG